MEIKMHKVAPLFAALLLAPAACANMNEQNQEPVVSSEEDETRPPEMTRRETRMDPMATELATFLAKVQVINDAEIRAGQMAQAQGMTPGVQAYGRMLVQHHEQANQWVQETAQTAGVQTDHYLAQARQALRPEMQAIDRLATVQSESFDDEFLATMADAHRSAIDMVRLATQEVSRPEVQKLATRLLPVLEQHHNRAQELIESPQPMSQAEPLTVD